MFAEARPLLSYVPVVLRLTLAAIFLYRGFLKVGLRENLWGAAWADRLWQQHDRLPREVEEKFTQLQERLKQKQQTHDVEKGSQEKDETKDVTTLLNSLYYAQTELQRLYSAEGRQVKERFTLHHTIQLAVAWGELLGGGAMLLGVLTRLAALGLIIIQAGAIALVTYQRGFAPESGVGYEYNIALLAMCLSLLLAGAGPWSLDHWWAARRRAVPKTAPAGSLLSAGGSSSATSA
jgi:uncharacterized membrane protein YphA (DoxX/SURF4 family)